MTTLTPSTLDQAGREKEIEKRRSGVGSAVVSWQLEGIQPTAEFLKLAERYISLEIDGKEFRALAAKL